MLHLRKVVVNDNGGTAVAADFTLTADGAGANDVSGTAPVDSAATLDAGTFALSEAGPAGYAASSGSCVGGNLSGANLTLGLGDEATCTITNNDIPPKLHLRKVVVNDNGGTATSGQFTLTADGAGSNDLSGTTPVDSGAGLQADTWALSENGPAGYAGSAWVCVGGTQIGSNITVGIGGEATCTITNNDQTAHLTLVKTVTNNNGGTAVATDFTLSAAGPTPISGAGGVTSDVNAGTYALSETSLAGYTAGLWSCDGGTFTAATETQPAKVALTLAQSATCTINNNDIAPKLHLRKIVTNDNGGTATVAGFTLTADGAGVNDVSGSSPVDSLDTLQADTWALSESSVAGYTPGAWICVGGSQDGANITVGIGGEATCTITNNDIAPVLHLRKIVTNDNGGTATTADFPLTANGTGSNDLSGTSPVDSPASLLADTFALSETSVYGYTASDWVCVGGTQNGSNITLGLDEEATCTITNDDIAPVLHLRKVVVNDNGGTASGRGLHADGRRDRGQRPVRHQPGGLRYGSLKADTFELSETTVAGYAASAWSCVGGSLHPRHGHRQRQDRRRPQRFGDVHHHQRRHRAGAAPAQGRGERQRWHRHGRELPAQGRRGRGQRPVRHQPGGLGYGAEG